ncbi:MAG: LysR family transcriptional regulator [Marivita sp.]
MLLGFYRESNQFALGALEIDVAQLPKGRFFLLNFTQLQHFKLVAQEGSFARAADLANITQSAMSNSIRNLEKQLGFDLFERSERPVRPTLQARNILSRVDAVLFEMRNLDQSLNNLVSGQGGHVRLGMTPVFSTSLAGPIIAEWHDAHRDVKLDLVIQETVGLVHGLENESLDVIVGDARELPADQARFEKINVLRQSGGAFCRTGHPILDIRQPLPSDLARYRFAGTHFPSELLQEFAQLIGRGGNDLHPIIAIDSHNIAALRDAVVESDLILLTTSGTVRNAVALGILRQIPIDLGIGGEWSVVTHRGRVVHAAVPQLIRKIVEVSKRENEKRLPPYARQFAQPKRG